MRPLGNIERLFLRVTLPAMKINHPTLGELARYATVSTIALFLGVIAFLIGLAGEISWTNHKLMLGAILIVFGFAWKTGSRVPGVMSQATYYDDEKSTWSDVKEGVSTIRYGSLIGCLLLAAVDGLLIYAAFKGHLPECISTLANRLSH